MSSQEGHPARSRSSGRLSRPRPARTTPWPAHCCPGGLGLTSWPRSSRLRFGRLCGTRLHHGPSGCS